MNKWQIKAIDANLPDLLERADTVALIAYFYKHGAFNYDKFDELRESRFPRKQAQAVEFFKTIKEINNGWDLLMQGLKEANQSWLWTQLFATEQVNLA